MVKPVNMFLSTSSMKTSLKPLTESGMGPDNLSQGWAVSYTCRSLGHLQNSKTYSRTSENKDKHQPKSRNYPPPPERVTNRVAQEPNGTGNRNRRNRFSRNRKRKPEPPEPFSRNRNRNRPLLLNCSTETQKTLFAEEPPEPKTGTGRTVPPPNHNRTEPGPPW